MNKFILLFFSLIILSFTTYAQKQFAYLVECVSVENSGSITIKIWNTKKGKRYSQIQARKDAIDAILYSGVPGKNGCIAQKPLLSAQKSIDAFRKVENDFFSKKGVWSKYTREANMANVVIQQTGNKKWKVYEVSISKDLLRKYLEEQKIIKSLNNGF
ncbi:hypothetical protein K8354_07940 [Polaribacter litorisediminis]|uniref:hypothetical protein n=1 Tax=Polaribacter litorisediminis TaxID=1908341 RepID=UPI001CBEE00F|nr:hypothetical protein [Polaribacter litorisediminis]UAM99725.1 hypothetical protein K8354_07940 [Polaribacter litorisediminis]